MTERGLGWLPDPAPTAGERIGSVARSARALVASATAPREGTIHRTPWILDQGGTSACTGHYAAQAIYALTGDRCSPWFAWYFGRCIEMAEQPGAIVQDMGTSISSLRRAVREHGVCELEEWRRGVPDFARDVVPPMVLRMRAQRRNLDTAPIVERGSAAVAAVVSALGRGLPVGVVVEVDDRFDAAALGTVGPADGASRGRHIVTAWAWRTLASGRRQIQIVNSWGRTWGNAGCAWLDEDRVRTAPALVIARGVS